MVRGIKDSERRAKRRALADVILATLSGNADLHYYQVLCLHKPACALISQLLLADGEVTAFARDTTTFAPSFCLYLGIHGRPGEPWAW